jgi:hypothetical protein
VSGFSVGDRVKYTGRTGHTCSGLDGVVTAPPTRSGLRHIKGLTWVTFDKAPYARTAVPIDKANLTKINKKEGSVFNENDEVYYVSNLNPAAVGTKWRVIRPDGGWSSKYSASTAEVWVIDAEDRSDSVTVGERRRMANPDWALIKTDDPLLHGLHPGDRVREGGIGVTGTLRCFGRVQRGDNNLLAFITRDDGVKGLSHPDLGWSSRITTLTKIDNPKEDNVTPAFNVGDRVRYDFTGGGGYWAGRIHEVSGNRLTVRPESGADRKGGGDWYAHSDSPGLRKEGNAEVMEKVTADDLYKEFVAGTVLEFTFTAELNGPRVLSVGCKHALLEDVAGNAATIEMSKVPDGFKIRLRTEVKEGQYGNQYISVFGYIFGCTDLQDYAEDFVVVSRPKAKDEVMVKWGGEVEVTLSDAKAIVARLRDTSAHTVVGNYGITASLQAAIEAAERA